MSKKKALIVSIKAGGGHTSLANALQTHLTSWGYETQHLQILGDSIEKTYKLQDKLGIYELAYKLADNPRVSRALLKLFEKRVESELKKQSPDYEKGLDLVISTHFLAHPKIGKQRIMYIPDPLYHFGWGIKRNMDYFFCAWQEASQELCKKAPSLSNKVRTVGLIRNPIFYTYAKKSVEDINFKNNMKSELGLSGHKVILITGGGIFIRKSSRYLKQIALEAQKHQNTKILVLCGSDSEFKKRAQKQYKNYPVLEFKGWLTSEEMARYMCTADFTFSFSAAQTAVESTMLGTPCLIFDYIRGQETAYVSLLTSNKVALELKGNKKKKLLKAFEIVLPNSSPFELIPWQKSQLDVPEKLKQVLNSLDSN